MNRYIIKYELKKRVCESDKGFAFNNRTYNRVFSTFNNGNIIVIADSKTDAINKLKKRDFLGIYKFSATELDINTIDYKCESENNYTTYYANYKKCACCTFGNAYPVTRIIHHDNYGNYIIYKNEKYYLIERGKAND